MARKRGERAEHEHPKEHRSPPFGSTSESQEALKLGPALEQPQVDDGDVERFCSLIEGDRRELKGLLQQQSQRAVNQWERRNEHFSGLIFQALGSSSSRHATGESPVYPCTSITTNSRHSDAREILSESRHLAGEYANLEQVTSSIAQRSQKPAVDKWDQGANGITRALGVGRNTAIRDVKKVLAGARKGHELESGTQENSNSQRKSDEVDMPEPTHLDNSLANAIQYTERGVKRMAKGLPRDGRGL